MTFPSRGYVERMRKGKKGGKKTALSPCHVGWKSEYTVDKIMKKKTYPSPTTSSRTRRSIVVVVRSGISIRLVRLARGITAGCTTGFGQAWSVAGLFGEGVRVEWHLEWIVVCF